MSGVADRLAALLIPVVGEPLPVRISAWDGSCVGPQGVPVVTVHSAEALSRILWSPGELGAAQAYVTGGITVDIPIDEALRHIWAVARERDLPPPRPRPAQMRELASLVKELGLWRRPQRPASQVHVRGRLHSRGRDAAVIAAHYDISNAFYARILDETMAYSSGYVRQADLDSVETEQYSLGDAQRDKLELICRKLGLADHGAPRLLDVGCGWGSLSLYAAENYGAQVTGVTIAAEQKEYIDAAAAERGLSDLVSIRLQDYRDVDDDGGYDAVASIEMGEHAGDRGYPDFVRTLRRNVTDTGRVLVQQMSRQGRHPGGGPFIESFIAADMTMRPVGQTVDLMEQGGLEVRDVHTLREHYAWTARAWQGRFRARRQELTDLLGEEVVRVWELYLAGGMLAFEQGRMGVDQILAVPAGTGPSNLPAVRTW